MPGLCISTGGRNQCQAEGTPLKLKRQTSELVTVCTHFFESVVKTGTPKSRTTMLCLSNCETRYSVFQNRPGNQVTAYSSPPPMNQPLYVAASRVNGVAAPMGPSKRTPLTKAVPLKWACV